MIVIEYKEIYLATDSSLYIYYLLSYFTMPSNKQPEHYLPVLLRQAISTLSTAVTFRFYKALIAVCFLTYRVITIVPILPPFLAGSPLIDFLLYNYAQSSNRKSYCSRCVY